MDEGAHRNIEGGRGRVPHVRAPRARVLNVSEHIECLSVHEYRMKKRRAATPNFGSGCPNTGLCFFDHNIAPASPNKGGRDH